MSKEMIERHEGRRKFPYPDTVGKITIGVGRNLTDNGLSDDEIDYLYNNDYNEAKRQASKIPGWDEMSTVRQDAFIDMMFNLGPKLLGWTETMQLVAAKDWDGVADHLTGTLWHKQVGHRAIELEQMIREG